MLDINGDPQKFAQEIFRKYGARSQEFIMFQIKRCQENGHPEQIDRWKSVSVEIRKMTVDGNKKK